MKELSRLVGEMEYDGLIADLNPAAVVGGGTLAALAAEADYKRGAVLAKSAQTGQLYILGSTAAEGDTLTPDCILCDKTKIGTTAQTTAVYLAGCFNPDKLAMADGYTLTEADKDKLRERGIFLKAVAD